MLRPGMKALDFGCGPGPAMGLLLAEFGIETHVYDPIYAPEWPDGGFDLIFSTETFEHFHHPAESIAAITTLLNPGGVLAVMTLLWTDEERFGKWSYTRDSTHVCFYHSRTFEWIARRFGYEILHNDGRRVVNLMRL